jgi:beta-lactam-binding protein with PASTA domain
MGGRRSPITEVPDVVGLDAQDACAIVRAAGLEPFGPDYVDAPESGVVTGQAPIATAGAERGAPVFLWTGRGKSSPAPVVPPRTTESLTPV